MPKQKYKKENGLYWDTEEDKCLHIFFSSGATALQKTKALNLVLPKLKHAARIIIERYYNRYNMPDMVDDAVYHFLLYSDFDETRGSYYSYFSNIFKHYFYDKIIIQPQNNLIDNNIDISDNEWLDKNYSTQSDFDEFDLKGREEKLHTILIYFNKHLKKINNTIKNYNINKSTKNVVYLKHSNYEREYILACMEYFKKYFVDSEVSSNGLTDWMNINYEIPENLMMRLGYKYFHIFSTNKTDKKESKNELRWKEENRSYIQNDFSPNLTKKNQARVRYRKFLIGNISEFEYF